MGKIEVRREALGRQGTVVGSTTQPFRIYGDQQRATFEPGGEGLVQTAVDDRTGIEYRIKSFWEPTQDRRRRSEALIARQLANARKRVADALGGAPFAILDNLGPNTPFAIVMKSVPGASWKRVREQASIDAAYPPHNWPSIQVRATWAYGLATGVKTLEARQFVHADVAPGNVIVTRDGATAGDMALVDFDGYADIAQGELKTKVKGDRGYAAPEIWKDLVGGIGSDRVGMAILIQEFLVVGDPTIDRRYAFDWGYDQDTEILSGTGEAHPLLTKTYPELAEMVVATLRTSDPKRRPDPEAWRTVLRALIDGKPLRPPLRDVMLEPNAAGAAGRLAFADNETRLDLARTAFGIRATLERLPNGTMYVVVHDGAEVRAKKAGTAHWEAFGSKQRVPVTAGLVLFDSQGKMTARIDGRT